MEGASHIGTATTKGELPLELDSQAFRAQFPHRPFVVKHNLADHPLFAVPQLLELAKVLPASCVEYNEGRISADMGGARFSSDWPFGGRDHPSDSGGPFVDGS